MDQLGRWPRSSGTTVASLVRFAVVGGSANVVYVLAFWALTGSGTSLANAVGFVSSTALATELHRRVTFRARGAVGWLTAQLEGGGLALVGLAATTASLAALHRLAEHPSTAVQAALLLTVTGLVGLGRFLALRAWFRPGDANGWAPAATSRSDRRCCSA